MVRGSFSNLALTGATVVRSIIDQQAVEPRN